MMNEKKRQKRIQALEILYQMEFQNPPPHAIDEPHLNNKISNSFVVGVKNNITKIDSLISQYSQNWKIDRIALLDLNILRIAIYEISFNSQKHESFKIYINEAIEIAKIYGGKDSSKFINGILDSIAKKQEQDNV